MDAEMIKACAELKELSELEASAVVRARMKFLARIVAAYCDD